MEKTTFSVPIWPERKSFQHMRVFESKLPLFEGKNFLAFFANLCHFDFGSKGRTVKEKLWGQVDKENLEDLIL